MAQNYFNGTISVTNGSLDFTGAGTAWELALIKGGIVFVEGHVSGWPIGEIVSDTAGKFALPWSGPTLSGVPYVIFRETAQAASAVEANDRIAEVAYRLRTHSYINFDASGTLAQRAAYNSAPKDFIYLRTDVSPFQLYVKSADTSGAWAGPNNYGQGAQGDTGPIAPFTFAAPVAAAPDASPAVTNLGTPTAPELQFTIPRGQGVRDRGNYAGGTAYDAYDTVLNNGSTWIALVTGPAGVAPPVLPTEANAKWQLFARKGTDGAGDMTGPSSSVDNEVVLFSGTTGKLAKRGPLVSSFASAANLTTGTLPDARLSATLTADKAFRRGNILGTVSQSSGVPTGAIVERGSNANGEYTKFADGTMWCWFMSALFEYQSASNLQYAWTYPASFIAGPYISLGVLSSAGADYQGSFFPKSPVLLGNPGATSATLYLRGQTSWEAGQFANNQRLFAIGRWF